MVRRCWVNFQCRGVLLTWITVGKGPIVLAVGAGGGCLDIFSLIYHVTFLSPSLWETARSRLKYCLKGPLSPNQPTNQPELWPFVSFSHFINRSSCLHNSSYSFQGILMKFSRYCCHDLKIRIFYQGHARLILPELWPFNNFSAVSLVSATPLAFSSGF